MEWLVLVNIERTHLKFNCLFNSVLYILISCSTSKWRNGMNDTCCNNDEMFLMKIIFQVHPYQWQAQSDYTDGQSTGGYYSVCIDNQFSRFASKLVNLYITVVKYDDWEKFTKEIEDLNLNMNNFTNTISTVEKNLYEMFQYQSHSRAVEARDFALIKDNNVSIYFV